MFLIPQFQKTTHSVENIIKTYHLAQSNDLKLYLIIRNRRDALQHSLTQNMQLIKRVFKKEIVIAKVC